MSYIYKICGKLSLVFYIATLYQLWHLCQYGGLRSHVFKLAVVILWLACTFLIWMIGRKRYKKVDSVDRSRKQIVYIELAVIFAATIFFGGRIIYSAIPYNGALSWKVYEWTHKKEIMLEHNNLYESGIKGILSDLEGELKLPEELYISKEFQISFDEAGRIQHIDTFLYGQDKKGKKHTYLIEYNAKKDDMMTVWIDGNVNGEYEEDMRLSPMIEILEKADWKNQVKEWAENSGQSQIYEILYMGRRAFQTEEGLRYIEGNSKEQDGYGAIEGDEFFKQLRNGGEIIGFEVSLHMPEVESVTPVRYMMEPEYISKEEVKQKNTSQQVEKAKDTESWTIDQSDGTMYFFMDKKTGWRLVVADAAAGSRLYVLEKSVDAGETWERINEDPFGGQIGVTEGLLFFDEQFGVIGLTGASQSNSGLYVTRDGGVFFERIEFPMGTVTELPQVAEEYGYTVEDYDYFHMPQRDGDRLKVMVTTEVGESNGIVFQSVDQGITWEYEGIIQSIE